MSISLDRLDKLRACFVPKKEGWPLIILTCSRLLLAKVFSHSLLSIKFLKELDLAFESTAHFRTCWLAKLRTPRVLSRWRVDRSREC